MTDMTYEQWVNKYKPITNKFTNDGTSFETYGDEVLFVCEQPNSTVWTELDGDNGVYLVQGYHLANRISYYVTEIPWDDSDDICITICEFVVCDCYDVDDEDTEPDQDCDQCGGDGTYTDWNH